MWGFEDIYIFFRYLVRKGLSFYVIVVFCVFIIMKGKWWFVGVGVLEVEGG